MTTLSTSNRNRLLARLPDDERNPFLRQLELVKMEPLRDLYTLGGPIDFIYFPVSGAACVLLVMGDGRIVELATIGNEGMLGIGANFGLDVIHHRVVCLLPGEALRLPIQAYRDAVSDLPHFEALQKRYTAARFRTSLQIGGCNALHAAEQRVCRWLLTLHDLSGGAGLPLTQEQLAEMLGVRRQTVSSIAAHLQDAGAIRYRRGLIRILNRASLEASSCECYQAMKTIYEQTMPFDIAPVSGQWSVASGQ